MISKKQSQKPDIDRVRKLINLNPDSHQYFYAKASASWLDWLWDNHFLDVIKQKSEDSARYGYRTPEINYLVRVSGEKPTKVVDIMLKVPISSNNFNLEVVDQFLHICSGLPAQELRRMVKKIRDEGWINLAGAFNDFGIEYEKMLSILTTANDFDSVLILAEAILSVRKKQDVEQTPRGFLSDSPFYFNELSYTKVFDYLLKVDGEHIEKVLALVVDVMGKIVLFEKKDKKEEAFEVYDNSFLFDIDFFTLEFAKRNRLSYRDDVKNLAAIVKYCAVQTIGKHCSEAANLFDKYFKPLPDSRSMWRLRLFVLSLCPETFEEELKKLFLRLFDVNNYNELISGTEYQNALRVAFPILPETDKRDYVKLAIGYFIKKDQEKKNEKEDWHKEYGSRILSVIASQLTPEEKQTAEKGGFRINSDYKPGLDIGEMYSGYIVPRGPISKEDFGNLPIVDISKKLRDEWCPRRLSEQNKNEDFLNPLNAEGVGGLLRSDISRRLQDYINNANSFFERDILDQNYTYYFLRGIQEVIRENKIDVSDVNWDELIDLFITIKESNGKKLFENGRREREAFDTSLSGWNEVHSAIADIIQELFAEGRDKIIINFSKYREKLFAIISYLLAYPDPEPKDEKPETAIIKTKPSGSDSYLPADSYSIAINTVRGRAFQAFVLFMYQDGEKISKDVKKLYESVLENEKTQALMFMFGHYLPSFYFRDKAWVRRLLSKIFPTEPGKKDLYLASWEGYLSTNLYKGMFVDFQYLYERAIDLNPENYTKRNYFKDLDEALADHIALAYVHFNKFNIQSDLFKKFWDKGDVKRNKELVSFVGRHCVSRESASIWAKENEIDVEKLKIFWDWVLENYGNVKILSGFGFWINQKYNIFNVSWLADHVYKTLQKNKGDIGWDYGLEQSLLVFAKEAPVETINILNLYLKSKMVSDEQGRRWIYIDDEWVGIFKVLYQNPKTKIDTQKLINELLPLGNGRFWKLKEALS
ncbi:MAG: hypothetical protein WC514_01745 [Candidatus Paceibacterota bacterium]